MAAVPTSTILLKNPIVLVHGLGARSSYGPFEYFHGLPKRLREAGNRVFVAKLTPWQSIEHRAQELKEQIEAAFPDENQINLVGHSMGGLDIRYLVSRLGFADRAASVTTIGTPHRGTTVANIATGLMPAPAFVGAERGLKLFDANALGFSQMTTQHCQEQFATDVPDVAGVAYFSATSAIPAPVMRSALPVFWLTHRILKAYEGDNDGFVSVESARWGESICTYPGDHYAQIGQFLGRCRGMDYVGFQTEIFRHLKKAGM